MGGPEVWFEPVGGVHTEELFSLCSDMMNDAVRTEFDRNQRRRGEEGGGVEGHRSVTYSPVGRSMNTLSSENLSASCSPRARTPKVSVA